MHYGGYEIFGVSKSMGFLETNQFCWSPSLGPSPTYVDKNITYTPAFVRGMCMFVADA